MLTKLGRFILPLHYSLCKFVPQINVKRYSSTVHDNERKTVLIIGANGNIGTKLASSWADQHNLLLVDMNEPTPIINNLLNSNTNLNHEHIQLDLLSNTDSTKSKLSAAINKCNAMIHFAANNPFPHADWNESMDTTDMINNVFLTCINKENINKKTRIILASSNHVMGGYRHQGGTLSTAIDNNYQDTALLDPKQVSLNPATKIELKNGYKMDATPYAMPKVFGERLALSLSKLYPDTIETVIMRIGWNQPGKNLPSTLSAVGSHHDDVTNDDNVEIVDHSVDDRYDDIHDVENWFRHMWLSNVDLLQLFNCAVNYQFDDKISPKYTIVNGVSNNTNSRWTIKNDIGYKPTFNVNDYDKQNNNVNTKQPLENIYFD